jgi:hypothetical protein
MSPYMATTNQSFQLKTSCWKQCFGIIAPIANHGEVLLHAYISSILICLWITLIYAYRIVNHKLEFSITLACIMYAHKKYLNQLLNYYLVDVLFFKSIQCWEGRKREGEERRDAAGSHSFEKQCLVVSVNDCMKTSSHSLSNFGTRHLNRWLSNHPMDGHFWI